MTREEKQLVEMGIAEALDAEPESEEDRIKAELDGVFPDESIHSTVQVGERAFALVIERDDMVPLFNPGEYIIVDPDQRPEKSGDLAVVSFLDNAVDLEHGVVTDVRKTLLREIIFEDDGTTHLVPSSPRYPDVTLCHPDHALEKIVVGKVVEKQMVPWTEARVLEELEECAARASHI